MFRRSATLIVLSTAVAFGSLRSQSPGSQSLESQPSPSQPSPSQPSPSQSGALQDAALQDAHPAPARAARLTFIAGTVRIQRSENSEDDTAVLNMPLPAGVRIVTGDYGQAEIEFEDGSVARLVPNSVLVLGVLSLGADQTAQSELNLLGGLGYFELRKSSGYSWTVEANGVTLEPLENLSLRLTFDDPVPSFALLSGSARLTRAHGFATDIHAGESLQPERNDGTRYFLSSQIADESWDAWNNTRDQAAADAADRRTAARDDYAGTQGYGWSDLDANGNWYNVPGTGDVWQPDNADEGFDPYGFGNWVWGNGSYVWASGYTWGWTPFRCGNWGFFPGFGWAWRPDGSCSLWGFAGGAYSSGGAGSGRGFAGGGILIRGAYPPRHSPVIRPLPRPGQPHPVIPVRGPDGPRPPTIRRGKVRVAGSTVIPLPPIAPSSPRSASSVGMGLARDFPIDPKTRQPVLGVQQTPVSASRSAESQRGQDASTINRTPRGLTPARGTLQPGPSETTTRHPGLISPSTPQQDRNIQPPGTQRLPATVRPSGSPPASSVPARPPQPSPQPPPAPPMRSAPPPAPAPAPARPAPSSPKPA